MNPESLAVKLIVSHVGVCVIFAFVGAWPSVTRHFARRKHPSWRTRYDIYAGSFDVGIVRYLQEVPSRFIDFFINKYIAIISCLLWINIILHIDFEERGEGIKSVSEFIAVCISVATWVLLAYCIKCYEDEWTRHYSSENPDHTGKPDSLNNR